MNATLTTPQIRLVGLLAVVVVAAGGFLVVSKHKTTNSTAASSTPSVTTHATTTPTPTPTKPHAHTVTPAQLQTHGLPVSVARALQKHSVVVVSLTTPQGADEATTQAEAQAGAAEMHVGFVAVDVFHQRAGTAMLRKLGVVDTPVTLVIKRPANIVSQFPGLVDRDVVAQAVAEAR